MKKSFIRQRTIDNMVGFLNLLKGQSLTSRQVNDLAREFGIRANVHNFAFELNFCTKKNKDYVFADYEFEPHHARKLIQLSNQYNVEVMKKAKIRKAEKEQSQKEKLVFEDSDEIIEPVSLNGHPKSNENEKINLIQDYFQRIFGNLGANNESKSLQEENELLKKNNEDLLFEIRNLKAQISALELQNSLKNNLSNFDEEEILNLRGKVEGFEMLFSYYFK